MKVVVVILLAVLIAELAAGRGLRVRRGYNSSGYGLGSYGRGSDERDASVSQEGPGCNGNKGYGSNNSGSRELAFKDGRDSGSTEYPRGSRSFSRASASASSSSYSGNLKANLVEALKPKL